jgi:hypothetical protein
LSCCRPRDLALLALVAAAACHRGAPDSFAPQPSRIDPAGGPLDADARVSILGQHFYARGVQSLSSGTISVKEEYTASLDGLPLSQVERVSDVEIRAVVPHGLTAGRHNLTIRGPYGLSGTLPDAWLASDLAPAQLVAVMALPAQVSTGQSFTLALTVTNHGGAAALGVIPSEMNGNALLGGRPGAQDVSGGASARFNWSGVSSAAGTFTLAIGADGIDEVSRRTVSAPAAAGQILVQQRSALAADPEPPAQVQLSVGQSISLAMTVTNTGTATAEAVSVPAPSAPSLDLIAAPVTQDVAGAMGTASFVWTYRAARSGAVTPVATGGAGIDANDRQPVPVPAVSWPLIVVQEPARLLQSVAVPSEVSTGQLFGLTVSISNAGEATARGVVATLQQSGTGTLAIVSGPTVADVPGGATASYSWTLRANSAGGVSLTLSASGSDENSGATVNAAPLTPTLLVQKPPSLSAVAAVSRTSASTGQPFQVELDVTNSGQATARAVTPGSLTVSGQPSRVLQSPAAQDVPGGATRAFVWTCVVDSAGTSSFTASAAGVDQNSGAAVASPPATSNSISIMTAAYLQATATIDRAQVSVGQDVSLRLDVTNSGQADALSVTPAAPVVTGNGSATLTVSPAAQDVPAQATRSFQWTYHTTGSGSLSFAATASGTDALSAATVSASASAGPLVIQVPASLTASIAAAPSTANQNQPISVKMTVSNPGGASAQDVTPALAVSGSGALLLAGPVPASASISGGSMQDFSWSYSGTSPGTLTFSGSAAGADANSGQSLSAATGSVAVVTVQTPAALSAAVSVPGAVNVGQGFDVSVVISNSGDSAATGVSPAVAALAGSGTVTASGPAAPPAATIPGHMSQVFVLPYAGSAAGGVTVSVGANGVDATDGRSVAAAAASASTTVQTPAALTATLSIPTSVPLGDTFTVSLNVTNSGDAAVSALAPTTPSPTASNVGDIMLVSGPIPAGPVLLNGHAGQAFVWTFAAAGEGTLQLSADAAGSDANDGTWRSVSATSASSLIAEAAPVTTDPFLDGTAFSFIFAYDGQLWLGPAANGSGAVRMDFDGRNPETVGWQLEHDSAARNTAWTGIPATTIGSRGCGPNTKACGPDNESGRGLFFSGVVAGTEWLGLAGAHANSGTDYARFVYLSSTQFPATPAGGTHFAYVDLVNDIPSSANSLTSAAVFHDRLYLGFQDGSGQSPVLAALTQMPSLPGFTPGSSLVDLGATNMPGVGGGSMIDSMTVFGTAPNDALYLANADGLTRSTSTNPGQCQLVLLVLICPDWTSVTPSNSSYVTRTSVSSGKFSDLEPADRAVPAMAAFGGHLFVARNTTSGPQLWSCAPASSGNSTQCDSGDWSLVAPNTTGDTKLTQFNDSNNASLTLLTATPQHLYVGFNNASRGVVIYRTAMAAPAIGNFAGRVGCAATGPGCAGLGGDGMGAGLTRIYDGKALQFAGSDYLYVAAGTGAAAVRVYRIAE